MQIVGMGRFTSLSTHRCGSRLSGLLRNPQQRHGQAEFALGSHISYEQRLQLGSDALVELGREARDWRSGQQMGQEHCGLTGYGEMGGCKRVRAGAVEHR